MPASRHQPLVQARKLMLDTYALTRHLRKLGLYAPLYRAAQSLRGESKTERAALQSLRGKLVRVCRGLRAAAAQAHKRVLVCGWPAVSAAVMQLPIVAAFISAGYRPTVVLPSRADRLAIEVYGLAGVDDFAFWTELPASQRTIGRADLEGVRTVDDALTIEEDGIRVGRYALSTMMRNLRRGRFDLSEPEDRQIFRGWLQRSGDAISFADELLAAWKPDALLLNDQGYIPLGPLFERASQRGIGAYTWNASHRDNCDHSEALRWPAHRRASGFTFKAIVGGNSRAPWGDARLAPPARRDRALLSVGPMVWRGRHPVQQDLPRSPDAV